MAFVENDSFFQVSVFQTFDEESRAIMQDGFKGSADFRVVGLSILDSLSY